MATSTAAERKAFAKRLIQACDNHSLIPPLHYGRQAAIANSMMIAREAVHAWFMGVALPNNSNMVRLAKLLNVDVAWLMFGKDVAQVASVDVQAIDGELARATAVVRAILAMGGADIRDIPPSSSDYRRISFYLSKPNEKKLISVIVAPSRATEDGDVIFVPSTYREGAVIAMIRRGLTPYLVLLGQEVLEVVKKGREREDGSFSISCRGHSAYKFIVGSGHGKQCDVLRSLLQLGYD